MSALVESQAMHAYAHNNDVHRKKLSCYSSIANVARENENCKSEPTQQSPCANTTKPMCKH
eukprot:10225167-Ditylum_brightwellii.AAC.1